MKSAIFIFGAKKRNNDDDDCIIIFANEGKGRNQ